MMRQGLIQLCTLLLYILAIRVKIGRTLMRMYIKYAREQKEKLGLSGIAIIAQGHLIEFYEFKNASESECQFGGGSWYDMVDVGALVGWTFYKH